LIQEDVGRCGAARRGSASVAAQLVGRGGLARGCGELGVGGEVRWLGRGQ